MSVSAVGPDKQRAPYSNFGMFVDVAAPGGNLELDLNGDGLPDGVLSTSVGFDAGEPITSRFSGTLTETVEAGDVVDRRRCSRAAVR